VQRVGDSAIWSRQCNGHDGAMVTTVLWSRRCYMVTTVQWSRQCYGHDSAMVTTVLWSRQCYGHDSAIWSRRCYGHDGAMVTTVLWSRRCYGHVGALVTAAQLLCVAIPASAICRVGQDHIHTVYIRYFWQGNHQIYGHIRCIYIQFWPTLAICNEGLGFRV